MAANKIKITWFFLFIQLMFASPAISKEAEVIFLDINSENQNEAIQIKLACDLLGVNFKTHYIREGNHSEMPKSISQLHDDEVIIVAERVLKYHREDIVALFKKQVRPMKMLIMGINPNTDVESLKFLSENRIKSFRLIDLSHLDASVRVVKNDQISKELGGLEYPLNGTESGLINCLELADTIGSVSLINVIGEPGKLVCPVFLKTGIAKKSIFYLSSWEKIISREKNALLHLMPILMFIKHAFGERSWHGIDDYANLTVDDPWLREPYGYIRFMELCKETRKLPFHVTIGFIPYNYQKSSDEAIEIFRQCDDNLSLAIHGNNHDFSEFRADFSARSSHRASEFIHPDEKNILQALYRMDTFSRKTDLPYDRVMIFPRGMFTSESLGLLKKHNFLMTINSTTPLDKRAISDDVERARGIIFEHHTFPMVFRHGISDRKADKNVAAVEKSWIQMRLFLDLPVLLYTHVGFFKEGAHSFNSIARMINELQPSLVWSNLGTIAKKLYLQKKLNEHEIELLSFSSDIDVVNNNRTPMKFIFKKKEDFKTPIEAVNVDGIKHDYHQDGNQIRIEVLIEPDCKKNIRIVYQSVYQVGSLTYSDNGLGQATIRGLSDFRDIYLSKVLFGDKIVMIFYWIGGTKYSVIWFLTSLGIFAIVLVLCTKRKKAKTRNLSD